MNPKYTLAISLSVLLHVLLLVGLLFGDFSHTPKPTPVMAKSEPIQAVAIDRKQVEAQVAKIKKRQTDEAKRLRDLERRAVSAKEKRAREEKRIKTLEKQRKAKEKEKQKADDAAKASQAKAKAAEKVRKKKEQEKQKAEKAASDAKKKRLKEEAAAKKSEELRKQKIAEQKRKAQEEKERVEQERLLEEQMAEEMASRSKARRQQLMSEIERYTALVTQSITQRLITDRSTMEGKSCKLTISLAPSGFVTNVVIGKGDRIVCEAAKTAVYKAGTLPVSSNPDVFKEMNPISLTVAPEF